MGVLLVGVVSVSGMMAVMIWTLGTEIDAEKRRLEGTSRCSAMSLLETSYGLPYDVV
jgi:hypothetical protein